MFNKSYIFVANFEESGNGNCCNLAMENSGGPCIPGNCVTYFDESDAGLNNGGNIYTNALKFM